MRKRSCIVHSMIAMHQYVLMMNAAHRAHFIINAFNIISLHMLQLQLLTAPATCYH